VLSFLFLMKSNSISKLRLFAGINEVVSPRAFTKSGKCQEWFSQGVSTSRILPTI
jgi:hypothetical protein